MGEFNNVNNGSSRIDTRKVSISIGATVLDKINNYFLENNQHAIKGFKNLQDCIGEKNFITPLNLVLQHNHNGINLTGLEIDYALINSNLNYKNQDGNCPLMLAIINYHTNELKLRQKHWEYFLHNTNLNSVNNRGEDILMLTFKDLERADIFSDSQLFYLLKKSNLANIENNKAWQNSHVDGYSLYIEYIHK